MPVEITLPKLTHDMQVSVFVEWYKNEGDTIGQGDVLYAVETDKATAELEAEADGILASISVEPGDEVAVGQVLAYLLAPGEKSPAAPAKVIAAPEHAPPTTTPVSEPVRSEPPQDDADPGSEGRVVATPVARRVAEQMKVDLRTVRGSGPRGRVVHADVLRAAEQLAPQPPAAPGYEAITRTPIQRRAASRLTQMWQETPQFVLDIAVDMTEALHWRESTGEQISITALLVRAIAPALRREPQINSLLVDGELRRYQAINVGVAMATETGLVVPVIKNADQFSTREIQSRLKELRARAAAGRLEVADLSDGTFTLSNLGMYGVDAFTAVINPPQVAILACGRIVETPVGLEGKVTLRPLLHLRLTIDHRALDGALAAPFLVEVKRLLENPYLLI